MNANTQYLVSVIEAELARLDVIASDTNSSGFVVAAEDDLPDGWVRAYDDTESFYGLASEIFEALRSALSGDEVGGESAFETTPPHDHRGLLATYEVLDGFPREAPDGHEVWNDFHEFVRGIEVTDDLGMIVIQTNGGLRYGFAPTDPDYSAFNSTHDYSERFATAGEAIDAAKDHEATEALRDEASKSGQ